MMRTWSIRNWLAGSLLLLTLGLGGQAQASSVTVSGLTVDFTFNSDITDLFGIPVVVGDNLVFHPTQFSVFSANEQGINFLNHTVNFDVTVHQGYSFTGLSLMERGDYLTYGDSASVSIQGQLRVSDLSTDPGLEETDFLELASSLTPTGGLLRDWEANAEVKLMNPAWTDVNRISVTAQNLINTATSQKLDLAFAEKKLLVVNVSTHPDLQPVPLPASAWLLLSGLTGLGLLGRKKRSKGLPKAA